MLRSGRLIEPQIDSMESRYESLRQKYPHCDYGERLSVIDEAKAVLQIECGDIMTGWEIIAGLPLENQKTIWDFDSCLDTYGLKIDCNDDDSNTCVDCWKLGLCSMYRWNGEAWEVTE